MSTKMQRTSAVFFGCIGIATWLNFVSVFNEFARCEIIQAAKGRGRDAHLSQRYNKFKKSFTRT
jgi:hypothetical protein